jgi:hypothetical protein
MTYENIDECKNLLKESMLLVEDFDNEEKNNIENNDLINEVDQLFGENIIEKTDEILQEMDGAKSSTEFKEDDDKREVKGLKITKIKMLEWNDYNDSSVKSLFYVILNESLKLSRMYLCRTYKGNYFIKYPLYEKKISDDESYFNPMSRKFSDYILTKAIEEYNKLKIGEN